MGFFDEAGVNLNDIPDDPFGFGNDFWPIRLVEVGEPKVTANQDKIGMMVKWAVNDDAYASNLPTQQMRQWIQLPVPEAYWGSINWDPKNDPDHKKVLINLRDLFLALGFKNDEMGSVDGAKMLYRGCLAKVKPKKNSEGFWEFSLYQMKALPTDGSAETPAASSGETKSVKEMMDDEL